MTVIQLVNILLHFNPETRVLVDGYEGGFDEIDIKQIGIQSVYEHKVATWYGQFDYCSEPLENYTDPFTAVILHRINKH